MGDVTKREQKVCERPANTSEVPIDDVPDQPSSPIQTKSIESQPIQDDQQEVLDDKSVSTGRSKDREAPFSTDTSDYKGSTMEESTNPDAEELENLPGETTLTLQSATIDCNSENYNMNFPPSPGERQRPIRNASRPTRYRDAAFDTQFQPRPRRHRRIRRRDATGNYVINKGAYFQLGRGVNKRRAIPMENKEEKSEINQGTPQPPKNNQRRYARRYAKSISTMASRPLSNIRNPPEPAKTSRVLQKRLSPAVLRSSTTSSPQATSAQSSTTTANDDINKTTITEQLDCCPPTRPTAEAAAAGGQTVNVPFIQKTKVTISTNGKTDTSSVSVRGKIQTVYIDTNAVHPHRFRRKKYKKNQRQLRREQQTIPDV